MNRLNSIALLITLCSACSKIEPAPTDAKEIKASAAVATSRSIVSENDSFDGIVFVRWDDENDNKSSDFDFSTTATIAGSRAADGTISFLPIQHYPSNNRTVYLLGYYPGGTLQAGVVTWVIDGATDLLSTNVWNAGNLSSVRTQGMAFEHRLARIEVICQAEQGTPSEVMESVWGSITSVKFAETLSHLTYTYASNQLTGSGELTDIPLFNGSGYVSGPFAPSLIPENGSSVITASAMVLPSPSNTVKLKIATTKKEEREVTISLSDSFQAGKIHTVTLTFSANGKEIRCNNTTITPWLPGTTGAGGIPE